VILINGDNTFEADETFKILLTNPIGLAFGDNAATVTIVNDDTITPPTLTVAATDTAGAEQGSDPIVFTVSRIGNVIADTAATLAWSGTATLGTDYTVSVTGATISANNLTLTFTGGSTTAVITLT